MPDDLASTPEPPYYAVIFTTVRQEPHEGDGYAETDAAMSALAAKQPGYLGVESARAGVGITVSYWRDEASIAAWKREAQHVLAQREGRARWYERYRLRVARVERDTTFTRS